MKKLLLNVICFSQLMVASTATKPPASAKQDHEYYACLSSTPHVMSLAKGDGMDVTTFFDINNDSLQKFQIILSSNSTSHSTTSHRVDLSADEKKIFYDIKKAIEAFNLKQKITLGNQPLKLYQVTSSSNGYHVVPFLDILQK